MINLKSNKAITLIALIITIIVMLILVAVTIRVAVKGELFGYAGKAVGDTKEAKALEQLETVRMGWEIEKNFNDDATIATYLANAKTNGEIDDYNEVGDGLYTIEKDGYQKDIQGERYVTFYVYHSSDNTVETFTRRNDRKFNIVNLVKTNYFYAGYFSDYEGKGSYAGDGIEVIDGTEVAYDGMNATWVAEEAYTENGEQMYPQDGVTYYLKELPKMYTHQTWRLGYNQNDMLARSCYIINVTDDLCYKERGLLVNSPNNRIQCLAWNDVVTLTLSGGTGTQVQFTAVGVFENKGITSGGYIVFTDLSEYVEENGVLKTEPYYITLDDVFVVFPNRIKKYEFFDLNVNNVKGSTIHSFDE